MEKIIYLHARSITAINLMIGLGDRMTRGENLVVNYREVVVSHQDSIGCVISFVTVRKIAIALLIDIAITRYKQISACTKCWSYAAIYRLHYIRMQWGIERPRKNFLWKPYTYSGWWQVANDFFTTSNFVGGTSSLFANVNRKALSEET